jgi:hypothetical protein
LEHLLFAAYLVLFAWLITKVKFFTNSGLTNGQLVIIFLLKVMAGILYGWIGVYYGEMAKMVDTWSYHYESIREYDLLRSNPGEFFGSLFHNSYKDGYTRFFSEQSWWNDLKANLFIKILAIFNLFSFGNYYINVILYSFLSIFGPIAMYRIMKDMYPKKNVAVLLATFLIPSFIYWTSGLHKDGFIFLGLSLVSYHIYFGLKQNFSLQRILVITAGLLMVLGLRNFFIVPLVPALLAWLIAARSRQKPVYIFSVVYLVFIVLFFTARLIHPKFDLPEAVVEKQQAFLQLSGGSTIHVNQLEPNFTSFVKNIPQALSLTILRPFPSDVRHLLSLAAALEIYTLLLLFIVFLIWRKNGSPMNAFLLFAIFFSFSVLLMIGYSNNNLGAIVRYRSLIIPFLAVPIIANIDWQRVGDVFLGKNNKNQ